MTREQKRIERKQHKAKIRAAQYAAAAERKKLKGAKHNKVIKRPVKVNGYNSSTLQARRAQRRDDANERNEIYQGLTKAKKIKLIKSRRGQSKRELARVEKSN